MDREDVNELILDEVDDIEDESVRQFIDDILRFERSNLDMDQPHYKSDYNEYIDATIESWQEDSS
ncbi:hypothetical protein [Halobaculum rubrum]|uniref:hypothetical protein n=1 Tax=Halobaculum rubrum TaxID=2872158 RepID=UPI001CA3BE47|nr:hypothetical protein [Halobaculum rubrum]QZY01205.1 hypothetical protein K6T25_15195 [Halobaculum rubrum]